MRKLVVSVVLLAFLGGLAFAQKKRDEEPMETLDREKKQQADTLDKQYKKTLEQTRKETEAPRNDPWSNMRTPNDGKR